MTTNLPGYEMCVYTPIRSKPGVEFVLAFIQPALGMVNHPQVSAMQEKENWDL